MINRKAKRLSNYVHFFSEQNPPRTCWNFDALEKSKAFIIQELEGFGYTASLQSWDARGNTYENVITRFGDGSKPILVVGAHYDVYGNMPGADDNASGVAGLLEIARFIKKENPNLDFCIEFVFYCLEEPPFFGTHEMGSYIHAKSLYDSKIEVKGMICLDMIGYFNNEVGSQTYPNEILAGAYPSTANFIVAIGIEKHKTFLNRFHELMLPKAQIEIEKITFPDGAGLAGLSDHSNYWHFDFPALMINNTAFLRNKNYHEPTDTPDTLNYKKMAAVVNAVSQAILSL